MTQFVFITMYGISSLSGFMCSNKIKWFFLNIENEKKGFGKITAKLT